MEKKKSHKLANELPNPNAISDATKELVGGIIEKGMSGGDFPSAPSSAPPRPSLLPFPVARHRSHGPHWSPNMAQFSATGSGPHDDDDENDEDDDPARYYPIAEFANPVQKKKSKGLDLSKWREYVSADKAGVSIDRMAPSNSSVDMEVERVNQSMSSSSMSSSHEASRLQHDQSGDIHGRSASRGSGDETNKIAYEVQHERLPYNDVDMGGEEFSSFDIRGVRDDKASGIFASNSIGYEQGQMSMESQIDAENRALLQTMSPQEIAEAQEEVTNKINPQLLDILKKRGLKKLEKQRDPNCTSAAANVLPAAANVLPAADIQAEKHVTKGEKALTDQESNIFPPDKAPSLKNTEKRPSGAVVQSLSEGGTLWDAWSKRVEAARNVRFSLDGYVIEGSSLGQTYNADNVAERDVLRTEGDPGAAGYTIKEALALTRSIVPGQRALALRLVASVLSKALHGICKSQLDCTTRVSNEISADWEAIWAYALGPEPELVLSLRMALDDNHNSVVLASAKVIQCLLACDVNENFFSILEKMAAKNIYTAPVFRSRPDIKYGFLGGGFWKYSTKPSNILFPDVEMNDMTEGEHTIQDDNIVATQDVAAGLVRMGILPRLCYILESDPTVALEECILSILVAIARHSPTCANAIWKCERLVQAIIDRFTMKDTLELQSSKIKSVTLLRVLAQSSKTICTEFIKKGFFQVVTWQLYRATSSVDEWVKCGRENCKLASELMIEQLRFWKVCIMYDQCVSYFSGFFPALCLWLNPPTFDNLMEADLFHEFAAISKEAYLVLETLATKLPDPYSTRNTNHQFRASDGDNLETWCWSDVGPMVDTALKWMELIRDSTLSKFYQENGVKSQFIKHNTYVSSLLWILSAITNMLHTVLVKATPGNATEVKRDSKTGTVLPDFVAKIALQIIKSGDLNFSDQRKDEQPTEQCGIGFFIGKLCYTRHQSDTEASLASVWCLHGLLRVIVSIDCLIQLIGEKAGNLCFYSNIPEDGILKCSLAHWRRVISDFIKLVASEWHLVHKIEVFGRGGPAPGVGVGWGASDGGFWSSSVALAQADAALLTELLKTFHSSPSIHFLAEAEETFVAQSINSAIALSLMAGPGDKVTIQKVLDVLLNIPVLKYFDRCIYHFLHCYKGQELIKGIYTEDDLMHFSLILGSHFRNRWLSVKKSKSKAKEGKGSANKRVTNRGSSLDTIQEDVEIPSLTSEDRNSLTVEWAHQRLPLPSHWLLSPITSINDIISSNMPNTSAGVPPVQGPLDFTEVAKAGLFFQLGIEAMSSKFPEEDNSPVQSIPLIWKLHSLSVALLVGMSVLEEENSRSVFEALQSLYGRQLDEIQFNNTKAVAHKVKTGPKTDTVEFECLRFQSEIHESYSSFIETLVEQFAAISYGDFIYGRQIAIYLHRQVDAAVRLATWNALSNARVLELLPPLEKCLSQATGYLEPIEEDHAMLEAYAKSWISGSLDRAAARASMTYAIAVHHLSSFIFHNYSGETLSLRNKLVKSLLRDYSRKQQHEAMILDFVRYRYCSVIQKSDQNATTPSEMDYIDQRVVLLKEACEGNSELLTIVDKLNSSIKGFRLNEPKV